MSSAVRVIAKADRAKIEMLFRRAYPQEPTVAATGILGMTLAVLREERNRDDVVRMIADQLVAFFDLGVSQGRIIESHRQQEAARGKH